MSLKDFAAFAVEDAQPDRSRRPRDIRGGDDRCRQVRRLNLDFPQSCWSESRRRPDKLDSERCVVAAMTRASSSSGVSVNPGRD